LIYLLAELLYSAVLKLATASISLSFQYKCNKNYIVARLDRFEGAGRAAVRDRCSDRGMLLKESKP